MFQNVTLLVGRRLIAMAITMLLVVSTAFFLIRAAPGSPFSIERGMNTTVEANLRAKYGFDQPPLIQYLRFLRRVAGFQFLPERASYTWHPYPELGMSIKYPDRSVTDIIREGLEMTLWLAGTSYLLAVVFGVAAGAIAAHWHRRLAGYVVTSFALVGACVPAFVLGPLLVECFSLWLGWLPPARMEWINLGSAMRVPSARSMVLPVLTLSASYVAETTRLAKNAFIETLGEDYIRTARAKGLPEWRVMAVHAFPAAFAPLLSFSGPAIAYLVTGTIVVESVFAIPGLGRYFVEAATERDFYLILGLSLFGTAVLVLANLAVEIVHAVIDPRLIRTIR